MGKYLLTESGLQQGFPLSIHRGKGKQSIEYVKFCVF